MGAACFAGGKTDAADKKGRTALHLAVGCSSRMVEKLLGLTVTIDAADVEGRTALHYAAQKGKPAIQTLGSSSLTLNCRDAFTCSSRSSWYLWTQSILTDMPDA